MDEQISKIYEFIKKEDNPFYFGTINSDSMLNSLLNEIIECAISRDKSDKISKLIRQRNLDNLENKSSKEVNIISLPNKYENKHLNCAFLIKNLEVYDGEIIDVTKYLYGYGDLSLTEFKSYLFWRTKIRNKKFCKTPTSFLCLYLMELCNFVEFDTTEETIKALTYLQDKYKYQENNSRQIRQAIIDFTILYTPHTPYKNDNLEKEQQILNGNYTEALMYFSQNTSYKIYHSVFWKDNTDLLNTCFPYALSNVITLFSNQGIDILKLWIGLTKFSNYRFSYCIKQIDKSKIISKSVFDVNEVEQLRIDENAYRVKVRCPCPEDKNGYIFNRRYIMEYFLKLFENIIREKTNFKYKLKPTTNLLHAECSHSQLLSKITDIFESDDFEQAVSLGCTQGMEHYFLTQ